MVFSTVLEINGHPIIYSVYKNGRLAFFSPRPVHVAPILYASFSESAWQVKGTDDGNVVRQVIQEIVG